jgi:hypothetical protein
VRKPKWKGELMGRAGGEGRETGMGGAPPFTNPILIRHCTHNTSLAYLIRMTLRVTEFCHTG